MRLHAAPPVASRRRSGGRRLDFVAFDVDGTLFDSARMTIVAAERALAGHGVRVADAEVRRWIGRPVDEWNEWLAGLVPAEVRRQVVADFARYEYEVMADEAGLFDGVEDMLGAVRDHVRHLGLYSNGRARYVGAVLDITGIRDRFDVVRPRHDDEPGKEPIVADLVARLGTRGVLVGDRRDDVVAGHANGLTVIGADYGYGGEGELDDADAVAGSPAEVADLVADLTG